MMARATPAEVYPCGLHSYSSQTGLAETKIQLMPPPPPPQLAQIAN